MADKEKKSTISSVMVNNKRAWAVESEKKDDECPVKEGDNCKVPGVFNDSDPIGGS